MESYLKTIKYIFEKNNSKNTDVSLNEFFNNGMSFPQFIAILFGIDQIPGIVKANNIFQISSNNRKALAFLGQQNQFFSSYSLDFKDEKNQVSLIQLILNKVYFNITKTSFLKKCNDYIQPYGLNISNFSEFLQGIGFMKLLNAYSNGTTSVEIKSSNTNQLIDILINQFNSLNIPVIIDKSSFMPQNHDILQYQAIIIIDQQKSQSNIIQKDDVSENDMNKNVLKSSFIEKNNISSNANSIEKNKADELNKEKNDDKTILKNKQENRIKLEEIENNSNIPLSNNINQSSEIKILQKISYLNIVNNIIETNNMKGIKFISEFQKGEILPKLVEIIFKDKIPFIVDNPLDYDQVMNNMNALFFINKKDPSFNPRNFNLSIEDDVINLIRILLKEYIFNDELINQINEECNEILQKYHKKITNFNSDWDDGINFVALLNFLSKGSVDFPPPSNLEINLLKSLFVKANSTPIIEDDAIFGNPDELVILYQLKIILDDIKARKIELPKFSKSNKAEIQQNQSYNKAEMVQQNQSSNKTEMKTNIQDTKPQKSIPNNQIDEIKPKNENKGLDDSKKNIDIRTPYKHQYTYIKDSCPILRMMNVIGANINLRYKTLDDIINGMTLYCLVKYLMDVPSIPGIKDDMQFEKMNLNSVLNFLKDNNDAFKYSSFDFNDSKTKKDNIIWFCTVLLKQFYLKESKTKMIQKASEISGERIFLRNIKEVFSFGNIFYKILGDKSMKMKNYYDEQSLLNYFHKAGVPFILDGDSLTNINDDYICFQLKLIFDHYVLIENESNKCPIGNQNESILKSSNKNQNENLANSSNIDQNENLKKSSIENSIQNINLDQLEILQKNKKKFEESDDVPTIKKCTALDLIKNEDEYFNHVDFKLKQTLQKAIDIAKKLPENKLPSDNTNSEKLKKNFDVFCLFKYKSDQWEYNEQAIETIKSNYKLAPNDIIHFILLLPSCTENKDVDKDLMYNLVGKLTGSKANKGLITNDVYVEIGFCGKIDDIKSRLRLKHINRKNEYLSIIQLRYPPSFKNTQIIYNMQAALTLQANYIISLYPITPINQLFLAINESIYKVINTPIFDNKFIGISQVLSYWPKGLDNNYTQKMKNLNILNQIDIFLNEDNELFKELRCCCDQLDLNIQWINENDFETYKNLIENALNFCQRNIKITNQIFLINTIFKYFIKANSEIGLQDAVSKSYELFTSIQAKPIFSLNVSDSPKENILFNSRKLQEFISFNKIEISSLYTIYFSFSNSTDVKYISQIFPQANIFNCYATQKNGYNIYIIFCGSVNGLIDDYNLKNDVKKKNYKSNLAFIYIENLQINKFKKTDEILLIDSIIAKECDVILTIANKESFDQQMQYANKLRNSLKAIDFINNSESYDYKYKHLYLLNINSINAKLNINENDIKRIPSDITKCSLNIKDMQSCKLFLLTLLNELHGLESSKKMLNFANFDANIINNLAFDIKLFQNCYIEHIKTKNDDAKSRNPMAELAAKLERRKFRRHENIEESTANGLEIKYYSLDKTIYNVANFILNFDFDVYSISNIDSFFVPIFIKFRNYNNLIAYLMKIKNGVTQKYIDFIASDFIKKVIEVDISKGLRMKEIKEFIQNSIIHIKKDLIEQLKDQLENSIKDDVFRQADQYCSETKKSPELKYLITNRVLELIKTSKFFERCKEEIDQIYNDLEKRNDNIQLDKNQIAQDSLKYVLTVRESLKEMTVEIACNEDLEKEIPQDF